MNSAEENKPEPQQEDENIIEASVVEEGTEGSERKSLQEIGNERKSALFNKGKEVFGKTKNGILEGLSWLKKKAGATVDYAFAAPEAIQRGAEATKEGAVKGINATVDAGKFVGGKMKEGVEHTTRIATEKFDALMARGKQTGENLKSRGREAKSKFDNWRNERSLGKLRQQEGSLWEQINPLVQEYQKIREMRINMERKMAGQAI
ncbi:MAG: hypothetical protein US30_C0003G0052 [Candidatus Moranbacteria bacterium GW2011_GWF2_36_839]|nr:MAG: hypothetical protein US27_C0004G0052 [Candidatus Moranbacteria bacterium GW2011_GWF1_36_78]KKQ17485.1 MAG: hypothetical protein US30_C0003G0052 [Candidatus Moranbacteria bacterium GW2011_GWF2_36_839]HAT73952.1 hypothetical protein [Candidatus Moranbacteria bacterium]HBY10522.1 hypothetical protein [Candidatus Moranbacteria bacterium]